ncbi:HAMP domain-containing histidine kinase [Mucilaginibacter sp. BJC16-A38]|uniref:sensor histidine kinase n=1 Tax=Mucilaginibacter phenanthrenivorans TaxID=1234842 RepID=UPI002157DD28|nr:HAMP domain-containing sensor histidine kinase [Mucilaginibacter phenanthrenivorans]MCR8560677.1 HAMP domain-containing histidine kinase [Mucilaginibacter phenanthrenivorans]
MKLSSHYNKASIIVSVLVLFAAAIIYYFAIHKIARNQLDSELSEEIGERIDYVNRYGKIPKKDFDESLTEYSKIPTADFPTRFFDTVYYNTREKTNENGRAIAALIKLNGENYKVIITESYASIDDLTQVITLITLVLTIILLFVLFITNKYVLKGLWRPFYHTLHELKTFNISVPGNIKTQTNKVDEFNELNAAVQLMSARVKKDYEHLKHFTENASHEMMTPLAVITAKLDTLIQDESLKPEHYDQINDIYSATGKLSRLNQSMLLLVKIENNLINDGESINLHSAIAQKLRQFQELLLARNITVAEDLQDKNIFASRSLIDVLLNNLFSNAIRHNIQNGKITITLTNDKLIFQNSGAAKPLDESLLFERFQKGQKSDGTGLGLTIVKNICALYNWQVSYTHTGLLHNFEIAF